MGGVGLFAGRGDVILSMMLALTFGFWLGWQAKALFLKIKGKISK
jgi:hypothetical protein